MIKDKRANPNGNQGCLSSKQSSSQKVKSSLENSNQKNSGFKTRRDKGQNQEFMFVRRKIRLGYHNPNSDSRSNPRINSSSSNGSKLRSSRSSRHQPSGRHLRSSRSSRISRASRSSKLSRNSSRRLSRGKLKLSSEEEIKPQKDNPSRDSKSNLKGGRSITSRNLIKSSKVASGKVVKKLEAVTDQRAEVENLKKNANFAVVPNFARIYKRRYPKKHLSEIPQKFKNLKDRLAGDGQGEDGGERLVALRVRAKSKELLLEDEDFESITSRSIVRDRGLDDFMSKSGSKSSKSEARSSRSDPKSLQKSEFQRFTKTVKRRELRQSTLQPISRGFRAINRTSILPGNSINKHKIDHISELSSEPENAEIKFENDDYFKQSISSDEKRSTKLKRANLEFGAETEKSSSSSAINNSYSDPEERFVPKSFRNLNFRIKKKPNWCPSDPKVSSMGSHHWATNTPENSQFSAQMLKNKRAPSNKAARRIKKSGSLSLGVSYQFGDLLSSRAKHGVSTNYLSSKDSTLVGRNGIIRPIDSSENSFKRNTSLEPQGTNEISEESNGSEESSDEGEKTPEDNEVLKKVIGFFFE